MERDRFALLQCTGNARNARETGPRPARPVVDTALRTDFAAAPDDGHSKKAFRWPAKNIIILIHHLRVHHQKFGVEPGWASHSFVIGRKLKKKTRAEAANRTAPGRGTGDLHAAWPAFSACLDSSSAATAQACQLPVKNLKKPPTPRRRCFSRDQIMANVTPLI